MNILKNAVHQFLDGVRFLLEKRIVLKSFLKLRELHFFQSLIFGTGEQEIVLGYKMHLDAPVSFLIKRNGQVCGVVSGKIYINEFCVHQTQGLCGVRGGSADYLLDCAEEIASTLGLSKISVRGYKKSEDVTTSKEVRHRKDRNYNVIPKERGYEKRFSLIQRRSRRVLKLKDKKKEDYIKAVTT